jgi:LPXTG-site transpeptidase (sortase) family protein
MKHNKDFWADAKTRFVMIFAGVFLATFLLLYFIGFVPDELSPDGESALNDLKLQTIESASAPAPAPAVTTPDAPKKVAGEKPLHITASTVGIDITVENPTSADNAVLNEYLTRGAVHYPGSGDLGAGNVFIFGHSSNWAVVHNKAYKALNGIDKLVRGDEIFVDSDSHRFVYQVTSVRRASADDAFVDLSSAKNMLTLSTCDIFGEKQNRFVAEATFAREISL